MKLENYETATELMKLLIYHDMRRIGKTYFRGHISYMNNQCCGSTAIFDKLINVSSSRSWKLNHL